MRTTTSITLIAGAIALFTSMPSAHAASKIEKVDMVAEGIDLKAVVVRNNGDYTTFENSSHRYGIRVFAKARGNNAIAMVALSDVLRQNPVEVSSRSYFTQVTPDDGWGVYKKSLSPTVKFSETTWTTDPRKVCKDNLAERMKAGMAKADVLRKEWQLTTHAVFGFHALATTKAQAKKQKFVAGDAGSAPLFYKVSVTCRARN